MGILSGVYDLAQPLHPRLTLQQEERTMPKKLPTLAQLEAKAAKLAEAKRRAAQAAKR